jgi:ferredoxin-thioredoxin reductase catalytic subunit
LDNKHKSPDDAQKFVNAVAAHNNWAVNRDTEFLDDVTKGLATNYNRYGYYLCPCRDGDGERSEDADIVCPCIYAKPDQQDYGHCYCGLFLTKEFGESRNEPSSIPERRPEQF